MDRFSNLDDGERISAEAEFLSNETDYKKFLARLHNEEGLDLSHYKQNQMRRRLNMTVTQAGFTNYCQFLDHAKQNEALYRKFIDRITINVSEFLRNPEKFAILEERFLLPLLKRGRTLKIWSAGCSTGEEPYSLALLLEKHSAPASTVVLGWDFDSGALKRAAEGIYEDRSLKNVPPDLLAKHFKQTSPSLFQVSDALNRRVRLEKHNLLEDRLPGNLDIILCRNVVIYFKDDAKQNLFVKFAQALDKDGVLMIGASERIPNTTEAQLCSPETFFYVREGSCFAPESKHRDASRHALPPLSSLPRPPGKR